MTDAQILQEARDLAETFSRMHEAIGPEVYRDAVATLRALVQLVERQQAELALLHRAQEVVERLRTQPEDIQDIEAWAKKLSSDFAAHDD